ncbi:MAG: chitobiase/beta-hexosaminidase C-terminal domain-containing protein [Bacteroidales bacterium]|nr:chitobiase/beta-hexosaminidase C-terminal domain-containing protein [Bacteroidales bacterium]
MKRLAAALIVACLASIQAMAQHAVAPRSNVVPYYDEASARRLAYSEQPYYLGLGTSWQQRQTDSSVRYTKQIEAEKTWRDYLIYLNTRCAHGVRVYVNGEPAGMADDSRQRNEFLISPLLKLDRRNTLVVEALSSTQGALLEDTTLPTGMYGEPFLLFKNPANIQDFSLNAEWDATTAAGTLTVDASLFCQRKKGKYYFEAEVLDPKGRSIGRMGKWAVFNRTAECNATISHTWPDVQPWNAEAPVVYTLLLRLRNEKMEEEELLAAKFGFRTVQVTDGLLLINGKAVTMRGVAYNPGTLTRQQVQTDLLSMKSHNINAVRTMGNSPADAFLYELCDQMGLYVVCDANLLPRSDKNRAVSTDKSLAPLFEQRVANMHGSLKNHTCIIAWNLGDTPDNGVCMTAAYRRLKELDGHRPTLFSAAGNGNATDIIAPIRPAAEALRQMLARRQNRPLLLMSANGTDPVDYVVMENMLQMIDENSQLQGGFVEGWPFDATTLADIGQMFSPLGVRLASLKGDEAEFLVTNRADFTNLGAYTLQYNVFTNLRPSITGGELPVVARCGESEKVSMLIPHTDLDAGEELFIRFELKSRPKTSAATTMGTVELPLPARTAKPRMATANGICDTTARPPLPPLFFEGHRDWAMTVVDSMTRRPDSLCLCIDRMLRYTAADGTPTCDVRCTQTLFGSHDIITEYTIAPSYALRRKKLAPVVAVACRADSISWFGKDRPARFASHHAALTGTCTAPFAEMTRRDVRWCAAGGVFMQLLGTNATMTVHDGAICLAAGITDVLRLRQSLFDGNPATLAGADFPRMAADILEPPVIATAEPRFSQPLQVTVTSVPGATIHYTLDGSDPTVQSPVYTEPITITATTVVKAKAMKDGMPPSFTATRRFNYDHIVRTTHSRQPNTPYNVGADTILFDGQRGSADDLGRGWLGFAGGDVATTVWLAKPIAVEAITLRYAHAPATWAFAPQSVMVILSPDGQTFTDTLTATVPFDPAIQSNEEPRVVELRVDGGSRNAAVIRLQPLPLSSIPSWHRGKGLKPWLMMDEIEVEESIKEQ